MIPEYNSFVTGWVSSLRREPSVFMLAEAVDNTTDGSTSKVVSDKTIEEQVKPDSTLKTSNAPGDSSKTKSGKSKSRSGNKKSIKTKNLSKHIFSADCRVTDTTKSNRQGKIVEYKTVYVTGILTGFSTSLKIELFNSSYQMGKPKSYPFKWKRLEEDLLKRLLFDSVYKWDMFLHRNYKLQSVMATPLVLSIPQLTYPFRIMSFSLVSIKQIQEDLNYLKGNLISSSGMLGELLCSSDKGANKWVLKGHNLGDSVSTTLNSLFVKLTAKEERMSQQNFDVVLNYIKTLSSIVDLILNTLRVNNNLQ